MLYKIDGVIANPRELALVQFPVYATVVPERQTIVTTKTIPDPACGPSGCPDSVSETTTVTHKTVIAPDLAPTAGW